MRAAMLHLSDIPGNQAPPVLRRAELLPQGTSFTGHIRRVQKSTDFPRRSFLSSKRLCIIVATKQNCIVWQFTTAAY